MRQVKDCGEKIRIVAYVTRNNSTGITLGEIKKVWCQWWKEDFEDFDAECIELLNNILKRVVRIQNKTKAIGRRQTLDFLKKRLNDYRDKNYEELVTKARTVNKRIQNQTSKKHNVFLGRYRIIGTKHIGTYDEINNILDSMVTKKKEGK